VSRLRVGCVGTGFIAGRHLSALAGFPDVEVVAVADPADGRAREVADRHGARAYEDGLELLDREELDAVWLCVPPFAHGALEAAAIERRLPFFVEKPLATDLDTATSIAARVHETGALTAVGYHWRHLEVVERAVDALAGRTVQLVTGHWLDGTPSAPWWSRRDRSGGQVLEQTTHLFDLARLLVGEVDQVSAVELTVPRPRLPDADVPTASVATLQFSSGAVGTISSTCALEWRHRVGLQLVAEGVVVELLERGLGDHELRVRTRDGEQVHQSDQDPVAREDREFLDVLRGDRATVRVPYEEALHTHALACAADRSARQGAPARPTGARHD
jgi:myo-inositol 2-dehydrogenase/D-chiro-inositol 1-dehydrogenase